MEITQFNNILPEGFNGVFPFTNSSDEDYKDMWNSIEYTFPAKSTVPLIIPGEPPEGVQNIRKKFARGYAVREFYKTEKFAYMNDRERGEKPALYTESDLEPFIQSCLEPLPMTHATAHKVVRNEEENLSKDEEGNPRTKVLKSKMMDPKLGVPTDESVVGNGAIVA